MKILLLTLEYPPQKGGVASYYEGLVVELKRQGYEVEVVSRGLLWRWIWPKWLRGYFTVRAAIRAHNPDILFVGNLLPLGTIAYLLCQRVPYAAFTHGMDVLMAQKSWRKRFLARKILKRAKFVVANSEFTKKQVGAILRDREKQHLPTIVLYPCPAVSSRINPDKVEVLRQRLGLSGKKILLTLGRVVERKGQDLVLRALPAILQQVPNTVYVVAGTGPDLARLQKLTEELQLGAAVRFVGEVTDEERPLYYALCGLFVMPARQSGPDVEGFGLSFLEAAQFGKPAIGGRSGGIPEAVLDGQTGLLIDSSNAGELAEVVVRLLRDEALRDKFGQNAQTRVLNEFTFKKQASKLAAML